MYTKKIVTDWSETTVSECNVNKHSLSLNKLRKNVKKATTVAAIIGIAISLLPAGAQAQLFRRANSIGASPVARTEAGDTIIIFNPEMDVTLGTSEELVSNSDISLKLRYRRSSPDTKDLNSLDSQGEFPKAIERLEVVTNDEDLNFSSENVTLLTSRLAIDPNTGNFPGLSFGYEAITDNNFPFATFNNDGIRYDFRFDNRSEILTLFIPSSFFPPFSPGTIILTPKGNNAADPINSIFYLSTVLDNISLAGGIQGVVQYPEFGIEQRFLVTGNRRLLTQVILTLRTSEELVSDSDISLKLRYSRSSRDTKDVNSLDSQGEFPKAIDGIEVMTNNKDLNFSSENVTLLTSRLAIDPNTGNFPGLSFGYEAITDNNFPFATFNNDGIRYDFRFDNRSEILTLFIPSSFFPFFDPGTIILTPKGNNAADPINSIFYLSTVLDNIPKAGGIQGVIQYPELGIERRF